MEWHTFLLHTWRRRLPSLLWRWRSSVQCLWWGWWRSRCCCPARSQWPTPGVPPWLARCPQGQVCSSGRPEPAGRAAAWLCQTPSTQTWHGSHWEGEAAPSQMWGKRSWFCLYVLPGQWTQPSGKGKERDRWRRYPPWPFRQSQWGFLRSRCVWPLHIARILMA